MKRDNIRRIICFVLLIFMLPVLNVNAAEHDPYGLTISGDGRNYSYVTPFSVEHTVYNKNGGLARTEISAPVIYRLSGFSAYCGYPISEIETDTAFSRYNLEDSHLFSDAIAGRLRAVILKCYPRRGTQEIQDAANRWLREREMPEIQNLQSGEAVLAAQIAIWKLIGGESYRVKDLFSGMVDLSFRRDCVVSKEELGQKPTAHTEGNVESLYTYFYNLEPEAPARTLLSPASIVRTVYSAGQLPDGSRTTELQVTISADIQPEDELTLTIYCGEKWEAKPLTTAGVYCFVFSEADSCPEIKLEITGHQTGGDVFLFTASKESSQILLGCDNAVRPILVEKRWFPVS